MSNGDQVNPKAIKRVSSDDETVELDTKRVADLDREAINEDELNQAKGLVRPYFTGARIKRMPNW